MNKCKDCIYRQKFTDPFTRKTRYKCGIWQTRVDSFGDLWLIIDGGCDKFVAEEKTFISE